MAHLPVVLHAGTKGRSMPPRYILGAVGGGFEACCSIPRHAASGLNFLGGFVQLHMSHVVGVRLFCVIASLL